MDGKKVALHCVNGMACATPASVQALRPEPVNVVKRSILNYRFHGVKLGKVISGALCDGWRARARL